MTRSIMLTMGVRCFFIVCGLLLFIPLNGLPEARFEPMGAAMFPQILLCCIIGLTLLDGVVDLLSRSRPLRGETAPAEKLEVGDMASFMTPIVASAVFLAYLALLSWTDIPYFVLTFVFLTLESWYLGHFTKKALFWSISAALLVTVFIYGIFGIILEVFFP